jgi:hypothetical protein
VKTASTAAAGSGIVVASTRWNSTLSGEAARASAIISSETSIAITRSKVVAKA